jgi:hypothetical protein
MGLTMAMVWFEGIRFAACPPFRQVRIGVEDDRGGTEEVADDGNSTRPKRISPRMRQALEVRPKKGSVLKAT